MSTFIATTPRRGLIAAEVAGNAVYKMLPQLHGAIESGGLAEEYKTLFAEPVEDAYSGGSIDWYTEEPGDVVAVSLLPKADQMPHLERLQEMREELHAAATALRAPSGNGKFDMQRRIYAEVLERSLSAPEGSLYLVGEALVLVCWGFRAGDRTLARSGSIVKTFREA